MLDKLLAQIKEFKTLNDDPTVEQNLQIVLARLKNVSNNQLQAIPQATLTQLLAYLRDSNPDEELLDWSVYILEQYKYKHDKLLQLEKDLIAKLSSARRETLVVKSSDAYSRVGDAEALKCKDSIMLICNTGTQHERDAELPKDRALQLEIAVQDYCKKQGRYWHLGQIHSDINASTRTNLSAFEKEYAQLILRAKGCFSSGLYSLGREYFAFKGEIPRADLATSQHPLDTLLEPLVTYNAEELSLRASRKLPTPLWQTNRNKLISLSRRTKTKLEETKNLQGRERALAIHEQQNDVLQTFRDIHNPIFTLIEFILGRPPSEMCIFVHGSGSRGDSNDNADLEPTFILKNPKDDKALAYAHNFLQCWDFLITALGKSVEKSKGHRLDLGSLVINYNEKAREFSTLHVQDPEDYAKDVIEHLGHDSETDNTKLRPALWYGSQDLYKQTLQHIASQLTPDGQKTVLLKIARIIENRQELNTNQGEPLEKKKETLQLLVWAITHLAIYRELPQNHSNHPFNILDWLEKQNILDDTFASLCREKLCWLYEKRFTDLPILTPGAIALQANEIRAIDVEILKPFARFLVMLAEDHSDTKEKRLDIRRFRDPNANRPIITDYLDFPANLKSIVDRIRSGDETGLTDFAALPTDADKERVLNTIDWSTMKTPLKKLYDKIKNVSFGHLRLHGFPLPMKKLEKLLKKSPNLQSFLLSKSPLAKENLWEMLGKHCKSLKELQLSELPNLTLPIRPLKYNPYVLLEQLTDFTIDGCLKVISDEKGSFLKSSAILLYENDADVNTNPKYALHYYRRALSRANPNNPCYEDSFDDYFKAVTLNPVIEEDPYFSEYSRAFRECLKASSFQVQKTKENPSATSRDPEFLSAIINGQLDTAVRILRTRFYQDIQYPGSNDTNAILQRIRDAGYSVYADYHEEDKNNPKVWQIIDHLHCFTFHYNPAKKHYIYITNGNAPNPSEKEKVMDCHNALYCLSLVRDNIKHYRTIDIPNDSGLTPLHCLLDFISCDNEFDANTVQFLVDNGAEIESKDNEGFTPLQKARAKGLIQIAIILTKMTLIESSYTNPARNITKGLDMVIIDPTVPRGKRGAHVVPSRAAQSSTTSHTVIIKDSKLGDLEKVFVMPPRRTLSINLRTLAEENFKRECQSVSSVTTTTTAATAAATLSPAAAAAAAVATTSALTPFTAAAKAAAAFTPTRSSTETEPTVDDINYKNGLLNAAAGKHDEAIKDFDKVIQENPKCMMAFFKRAVSKGTLRRKDDAIKDYIAAIRLGFDKDLIVDNITLMRVNEAKAKIKPLPQAPRSASAAAEFFKPAATFKPAAIKPADSVRGDFLSRSSSERSASPADRSSAPRNNG